MFCSKCAMPVFVDNDKRCAYKREADDYDIVSYILSTGKDYETNQETDASKAYRMSFIEQFPEYATFTFWKLQFVPVSVKREILDWFFAE